MSAECQICGAGLVAKEDGRQECPECPLKMRIQELEAQVKMLESCEGCERIEDHNRLLREENERLREAGAGYSQQTVDALSKERDTLRARLASPTLVELGELDDLIFTGHCEIGIKTIFGVRTNYIEYFEANGDSIAIGHGSLLQAAVDALVAKLKEEK